MGEEAGRSESELGRREVNGTSAEAGEEPIDLEGVLDEVGETAYHWDVAHDTISWAKNASHVLDVEDLRRLKSGRAFALHIDAEHAGPRFDALTGGGQRATDSEVRYRTQYRFLPDGRRGSKARWLEEVGLCQVGPEGKPRRVDGTIRVIDDWNEKEQRLRFLGSHDELTGQLNRTRLTEQLSELLSSGRPKAQNAAFILAAVNDLTLINETYGFEIGDQIISMVGKRLSRALRGRDSIGRFASNKFGVLLHHCPGDGLSVIGRRLMAMVREHPFDTSAGAVSVTISVGAVKLPEHANNAQLATGRALQALETARADQGDRFSIYQRSERRESERRRAATMADEIVRALNDRRMVLALQPIVKSKTREIVAYESLLRMQKLDGSVLPAGDFMPVAEKFGLAKLVDARVLELVSDVLRKKPGSKICVNVSGSVANDRDWITGLQALANAERNIPERLIVEISETVAIANLDRMTDFISEVRRLGSKVALDGFGTGYSSFRHLQNLGIDIVKIDSSFIENLTARSQDGYFVRTLVDLATNLGIATVGEGVGDEPTAEALEEAGISYMQGYFFGGPEVSPSAGGIGRIDLA